jgi:hypothetical protein
VDFLGETIILSTTQGTGRLFSGSVFHLTSFRKKELKEPTIGSASSRIVTLTLILSAQPSCLQYFNIDGHLGRAASMDDGDQNTERNLGGHGVYGGSRKCEKINFQGTDTH